MGSGKSTLGLQLAKYLHIEFYDLDKYIESITKKNINYIFKNEGEIAFRNYEKDALKQIINKTYNAVIATGGGTPCFYDNMMLMIQNGTVIYLKSDPKTLSHRIINSQTERPLIKTLNKNEIELWIKNKIKEREKFYNKAHLIVDANNISTKKLINYLKNIG